MENGIEKENYTNGGSQAFNENKVISNINLLLQSNNRIKALSEFDLLTSNCNDASFSENCVKWLQLCCKLVSGNVAEETAGMKLFAKILLLSAEFPELVRQIANSVTGRFLEVFSKHFICYRDGWNALEMLLLKYHGSFATQKEILQDLLKKFVNEIEVISTDQARCFSLFPLAGGGGAKNALYKSNWREQFDKFLDTCHKLLNLILTNIQELHVYDTPNCFTLNVPADNLDNLVKVFSNCCTILRSMILGPFPVARMIPVDAVLKLISRCLSISEITLKNKALISKDLCVILPIIHYEMVQTLSALVVSSKKTLLPVSSTISKILEQAIQNASICKRLGIAVYSCLSNWLVSAEGSASIHLLKKSIIPFILNDVQQKWGTVILRGKDKSKEPVRDKLSQFGWDEKICFSALKTLESLISTVGYKLEVHQHKMLQSVLLGIAFDLERGSSTSKWMYNSSIRCREALYSVIIQLCLEPSPHWPPPTQYAMKVLKSGINDSSPSVAKICLIGTTTLQRIIYPEFSIGSFPQNYHNIEQEKENHLNKTSAMDIEDDSSATNTDAQNKTPTKLVTNTSSPWESLSYKKNFLNIEIPSTNMELDNVVSQDNNKDLVNSSQENIDSMTNSECQQVLDIEKISAIKKTLDGKINSPTQLNPSITGSPSEFALRRKSSGSISSQSSIGDIKLTPELDSPMSLRSGTILASPSSNEPQRSNSLSPMNPVCDSNLLNSLSLKKSIVLLSHVEDNVRPSRSSSVSSSTTDVVSHMSLRSGTLLGSQSNSEKTRRSSISSQSSISCTQSKTIHSPVFEDEEIEAFEGTIRDDYY